MTLTKKMLAAFSALFLITACETAPSSTATTNGAGNGSLNGSNASSMSEDGMGTLPGTNIADRVFFDYDSSVINADGQSTLAAQAGWLNSNSSARITIEGHCDERGTREYNLALGERRAAAVKSYLVGQGVAAARVSTTSYGKERPAVTGSTEDSYARNRRGVTVVQ